MKPVFRGLWCRCSERHHQLAHYYVSVRDGSRWGLLLGPFTEHDEALAWVDRVRAVADEMDPRAPWYAFGTTAMASTYIKPGLLNDRLLKEAA